MAPMHDTTAGLIARLAASAAAAEPPSDNTETTTLVALSQVAVWLSPVVARWARCGLVGADLEDAEADLVIEALSTIRTAPAMSSDRVAQRSWHRVANRRRTERRRTALSQSLYDQARTPLTGGFEEMLVERITISAGPLTPGHLSVISGGAGGMPTCSPGALRTRRYRARLALRRLDQSEGEVA